jgi:hypothetical protein
VNSETPKTKASCACRCALVVCADAVTKEPGEYVVSPNCKEVTTALSSHEATNSRGITR